MFLQNKRNQTVQNSNSLPIKLTQKPFFNKLRNVTDMAYHIRWTLISDINADANEMALVKSSFSPHNKIIPLQNGLNVSHFTIVTQK